MVVVEYRDEVVLLEYEGDVRFGMSRGGSRGRVF